MKIQDEKNIKSQEFEENYVESNFTSGRERDESFRRSVDEWVALPNWCSLLLSEIILRWCNQIQIGDSKVP